MSGASRRASPRGRVSAVSTRTTRRVLVGEHELVGGVLVGHPHAGELREHAHAAEPVMILRMADKDRCPGGRPQHAGLAHPPAGRGSSRASTCPRRWSRRRRPAAAPRAPVGGVPGSRRAARGVRRGSHARVAPREGQREACGGDTVAQSGKCVEQLRPYVQGHHMRRMPNFRGILKHIDMSARRRDRTDGRDDLGHGRSPGITSAQHPVPSGTKSGARFVPACDYRDRFTEPPHRATEGKRQGQGTGSLSLTPGNVTDQPTPGHRTRGHPTGPRSSVDRAGAF